MSDNVIHLNDHRLAAIKSDGGRARIKRQRAKRFGKEPVDELVMLRPDPEIIELPSDCA
jgi:hypothetical protein